MLASSTMLTCSSSWLEDVLLNHHAGAAAPALHPHPGGCMELQRHVVHAGDHTAGLCVRMQRPTQQRAGKPALRKQHVRDSGTKLQTPANGN
jgi:hypothetical protein